MRDSWRRHRCGLELSVTQVQAVVGNLLPSVEVVRATTLKGGLANTNVRLDLANGLEPVVLRIWQRNPPAAEVEIAVLARVADVVPAPRVLAATARDQKLGLPCAILGWVGGEQLQDICRETANVAVEQLGAAVGEALANVHAIAFDKQGFLDANLRVATAIEPGGRGLSSWLRHCLVDRAGGARLGADDVVALLAFAERRGSLLDHAWSLRPCLTHADFNPSNLLLRQDSSRCWRVAGVLDWEFAFAGGPAFDFGHVIRPILGDDPRFVASLADAYREAGGTLPSHWRAIALMADLFAWADFLARPAIDETVIATARSMIWRIMREVA